MINFLYLLYGGDENVFIEAAYSIGTLRRQLGSANHARIIVFTDQPGRVKSWPVVCESVAGELAAMRGRKNFGHRAKICVILKCFEQYAGNLIFLDSDTFVRGDIARLAAQLAPGTAIMDHFECVNPELGLAGFNAKLSGELDYHFSTKSQMYNSGVIGLHRDDCRVARVALELCDAILEFDGTRIHTTEQFAVSEAMRICQIKLLEARRVVAHYLGHRFYMRAEIRERINKTGQQPWEFELPIPYSYLKVYWLKKFGYYLK